MPEPLPPIWPFGIGPLVICLAIALFCGILTLGPAVAPYGVVGRPGFAALLTSGDGVFLEAGPKADDELVGIDKLGLLPAKVDSDGFLDQGNISVPGIFHPLLHPLCVPAIATTTTAIRVQFASLVRMLTIPFDSL